LNIRRRKEAGVMLADDLCFRIAEHQFPTGVPTRNVSLRIEQENRIIGHSLDEQAEALSLRDLVGLLTFRSNPGRFAGRITLGLSEALLSMICHAGISSRSSALRGSPG